MSSHAAGTSTGTTTAPPPAAAAASPPPPAAAASIPVAVLCSGNAASPATKMLEPSDIASTA